MVFIDLLHPSAHLPELDCTLIENTRAIQLSIGNIVRAPYNLAEKCRLVLEELVHAQRMAEHNSVGDKSLSNNRGSQDANTPAAHGTSPHASPQQEASREGSAHSSSPSPNDMQGLNSFFDAISDEEASARSPAVPTTSCSGDDELPLIPSSSPRSNGETSDNLCSESDPLHPNCHSLGKEPAVTCGASTPAPHIVSHDRDSFNSPGNRHAGKRMTFRPVRYVSPFKGGIMLRPPPDMHKAKNLLGCLCADDSPFVSTIVIRSGSTLLNGSVIARSFAEDSMPDPIFMSIFVKCVTHDDYFIRPECHGYRIFLGPEVSAILNAEWSRRYSSVAKYSQAAAAASIQVCLPFTDLKKTKMILLPVLHQDHWSVYCVNFLHSRIDVLDSCDYNSRGGDSWDMYHCHLGKKIINRLCDALFMAAPHKFVCFRNWRYVQVKVPVQKTPSDSTFFAMKFLEWYDGDGRGIVQTNIDTDRSNELRAEMLYYMTFHSENKVFGDLPRELIQFRNDDDDPFFY